MKIPLSIIILTYNEEIHLGRLMENVAGWADEVIVVDSYSTDRTKEIAERHGAKVVQHKFENQAQQFNWALDNLEIKNEWILRLDADEYLTEELKKEIGEVLLNLGKSDFPDIKSNVRKSDFQRLDRTSDVQKLEINGFYIKRRVYFMGRWIKYGGYYPTWILRLFKRGSGRSEEREMDEHIILFDGVAGKLKNDFVDDNKNNLEWWTAKHNNFSTREARERLKYDGPSELESDPLGSQAERKRWWKENVYLAIPAFLRAFGYFFYRYFLRFGFLDGKEGLIFHFLQGCWHQFLIDAKMYEMKTQQETSNK